MRKPTVILKDVSRDFGVNEAFFSCTDPRGVIVAGNEVFARVSGYTHEQLLGKPHSIIRHPDMPRAVFRLLWQYLESGRPIAAYVKNLAKDGAYYWVLALVTPVPGGYLSIRFKPSHANAETVAAVYREMRARELAAEAAGQDGSAAMDAATEHLQRALAGLGFADYDAFMRTALLRCELTSRDAVIAGEGLTLWSELAERPVAPGARALADAYAEGRAHHARLCGQQGRLEELARLSGTLNHATASILDATAELRIVALNAAVKARRLGARGRGLAVVAGYLNDASRKMEGLVADVRARVGTVSGLLGDVIFNVAWLRLQYEMTVHFAHENARDAGADARGLSPADLAARFAQTEQLREGFESTRALAAERLGALSVELGGLGANSLELERAVSAMKIAQIAGLVEASHLRRDVSFRVVFDEVRLTFEHMSRDVAGLVDAAERLRALAEEADAMGSDIAAAGAQLAASHARAVSAFAAAAAAGPDAAERGDDAPAGGDTEHVAGDLSRPERTRTPSGRSSPPPASAWS